MGDSEQKTYDDRLRESVVNWRIGAGLFAAMAAVGAYAAKSYVLAGVVVVLYALGLWRSNKTLGSSTLGSWWGDDD